MPQGVTALVMAAKRKVPNPLAIRHGVSNKSIIDMLGQPLIMYALQALVASPIIDRIIIAIEEPTILDIPVINKIIADEKIEVVASLDTLSATVFAVADASSPSIFPLLITTADNAMLLPEHVDEIARRADRDGLVLSVGMTPKSVFHSRHPEFSMQPGACYELEDGGLTTCNLYYVRNARALDAATVFKSGGKFGTHPLRIARAFGLGSLLRYKLGWLGTIHINKILSKLAGGRAKIEPLPYGDLAIDVDDDTSFAIVEETLRARIGDLQA